MRLIPKLLPLLLFFLPACSTNFAKTGDNYIFRASIFQDADIGEASFKSGDTTATLKGTKTSAKVELLKLLEKLP